MNSGHYAGAINAAGNFTYSSSTNQVLAGVIDVNGNFTKNTANSTLTLSNASNDITGTTTVSAGTLKVSGSIGSSAVTVSNAGTVLAWGATGTIGNTVAINNGAILAAGGHNAAGTATALGATTFNNDSIFSWDIINTDGTGYDKLIAPSLAGDEVTPGDAVFRIVASDALVSAGFWNSNKTWTDIFSIDGTTANALSWASLFTVSLVDDNFNTITPTNGYFSATGSTLTWSYTPIPEPSSAVLSGLLITAGLLRRRRKGNVEC